MHTNSSRKETKEATQPFPGGDGQPQTALEPHGADLPDTGMPARNWAFTWNNYPADAEVILQRYIDHRVLRAAGWQPEIAPNTGTPHLQGWFVTHGPKSFKWLKAGLVAGIRFSQMRKTLEVNRKYCSKRTSSSGCYKEIGDVPLTKKEQGEYGKLGGAFGKLGSAFGKLGAQAGADYISKNGHVWSQLTNDIQSGMSIKDLAIKYPDIHGMYTKGFHAKIDLFRPKAEYDLTKIYSTLFAWQTELLKIIANGPDKRAVHWIWSPEGRQGKSDMLKHLCSQAGFQPLQNGTTRDLAHAWQCAHVAFDFSRDEMSSGQINYSIIEQIKNGIVFSSKYESITKTTKDFGPVFVVCFANMPPDTTRLSPDRWNIFLIDGETHEWRRQELQTRPYRSPEIFSPETALKGKSQ